MIGFLLIAFITGMLLAGVVEFWRYLRRYRQSIREEHQDIFQ